VRYPEQQKTGLRSDSKLELELMDNILSFL